VLPPYVALLAPLLAPPVAAPVEREGDVAGFRQAHRRTQLAGMGVLTGWAVVNIGGGVGASYFDRDRRYFHEGNAIWNSVNLVIGIVGLATNARGKSRGRDLPAVQHRKTMRTYLVNGVLDVVYVAAGAATIAIGQHRGSDRVRGYGQAIAFQGAFLFAFDTAMLIAHQRLAARRLRATPARIGQGGYGVVFSMAL
jgi:hypothetical protein